MKPRRATHCFNVLPKIFNNSYTFKKLGVLSTSGIFKSKSSKRHARFMTMNFNLKNSKENPLQRGEVDAEQTPRLDLLSQARVLNQVDSMLTLG